MKLKRLFSFSTLLFATVSSSYSQCIIAGTDFDTNANLCCPILNSDAEEGGWYEEDLDVTGLCSSDMFASFEKAKQKGVGGIFSTESSNEMTKVDKVFHLGTQIQYGDGQYGYSTVTAQPKLINPFFKANEESNNMFVNIGTADNCQFLTYTVSGLAPGSSVELSFTLYNLLDPEYFDYLVTNVCKGTGAKVPQLKDFITKYDYSNTGTIIGNPLKLGVISTDQNITYNTGYNNSIDLFPSSKYTTATASYGKSTVVTHKATVPASGSISFLFFRTEDCFQIPVGIDDIKVTGEVSPIIVSSKGTPCPMQPLNLTSRHNYPEGTKFSWKESVTNQTSSDASFKFIPDAAETDYSVTLEVTLPGCKASKSEAFNLHSGTCCTSADGVPMAMSYLFYDDFGNFISDDLYEWTDKFGETHTVKIPAGQVHDAMSLTGYPTIPYVRAYNIEASGAKLKVPALADHPNSADCGGPVTQLYCHGVYAVSKAGGYPDGVQYDNSGTKTGGMLQFDLLDDGTQDEFLEIDIDHICVGKEISFGADFASISEHPGCIEVSLEYNGNVLASEYESFNGGSDGWKSINKEFAIRSEDVNGKSEVTLTMKMKHDKSCGLIGETRDYAIDNIFFSVCTPPDVALQYSISKGDLLELSTGDVFTLSAVTSDAVTRFYLYSDGQIDPSKKLGYVYQYTFQDPSTENEINKIGWKTIHKNEVVETESFDVDIEKYWDDIFSKMEANDRIYFRVVIGEYSDLIADQSWNKHSALSPCRKVSISNIPVVAGLNCPTCVKPNEVNVVLSTGRFKENAIYLCPGDSEKLEVGEIIGTDADNKPYYNYVVSWYKNDINSTPLMKKACSDADHGAHTFTISYDDVIADGKDEAKYIILIHDNNDPSLSSTPCDHADTIRVVANQTVPMPRIAEPITYKNTEGKDGFKIPTVQNPNAIAVDSDCDLIWYNGNDKVQIKESDATPTYNASLSNDEEYTYYVAQVNNISGCKSKLGRVEIIVLANNSSLKDTPAKAVSIAPNPASTKISVIAEEAVEKVEILNMVGEVVKVSNSKDIDTSNLSNGVYFVRTTINDETTVHKLVINK